MLGSTGPASAQSPAPGSYTTTGPTGGVVTAGPTPPVQNPSIPYSGPATAYGGRNTVVQYSIGHVACSGTITTVFNYQSQGAWDIPAQSVIVTENSDASFGSQGVGPSGACASGLGTTEVDTTGTDLLNGDSNGARYQNVTGAQSLTFTITPSSSAHAGTRSQTQTLLAAASVNYSVVLSPVTISLHGVTLSNGALYVLTGQQVTATLVAPYPVVAGSYSWSTKATDAFKDYTFTQALGALVPFATTPADDKKQPSFSFYTRSTEPADVTCNATLQCPDGTLLPVTATLALSSLKPTATAQVNPTNTSGTAGPFTLPAPPQNPTAYGLNHYIEAIQITVPAPFSGGTGAVTQIVTSTRWSKGYDNQNVIQTYYLKIPDGNGGWTTPNGALDDAPIYRIGDVLQNMVWVPSGAAASWAVPNAGGAEDGPTQAFEFGPGLNWFAARMQDSWTSYEMYQPPANDGTGTVWVPLLDVVWDIVQTAQKSGGVWSASVVVTDVGSAAAATAPPQWTTAATSQQMMQ